MRGISYLDKNYTDRELKELFKELDKLKMMAEKLEELDQLKALERIKELEELKVIYESSRRLFWSMATNGNSNGFLDALLQCVAWVVIVTVVMFMVYWVLVHLGSGEPYP